MSDGFVLNTAVALFVFNRPQPTQKVFAAVKSAKPPVLLIVADGARANKANEAELCEQTRAICTQVDWPCKVLTNFSDKNLGCKQRLASGLEWVFEQVEEAIILEDDCVPNASFFRFCQELLEKYRFDNRIGLISGDNFLPSGYNKDKVSYYFSKYTNIWGWASWRRAFQHYDLSMKEWPHLSQSGWLENIFSNDAAACAYWRSIFNRVYKGEIDTWDYQLTYSFWVQNFLSICPAKNLITNIGFGADATHTHEATSFSDLPTFELDFPLTHPVTFNIDTATDEYITYHLYRVSGYKPSVSSINLYNVKHSFSNLKDLHLKLFQEIVNYLQSVIQIKDQSSSSLDDFTLGIKLSEICIQHGMQMQNLYLLRGLCFLFLNDLEQAKHNLTLEINHFPENNDARGLLENLSQ